MNGKGSKQRPKTITEEQLAENWARIFGNKPCTTTTQTSRRKMNTKIRSFNGRTEAT